MYNKPISVFSRK